MAEAISRRNLLKFGTVGGLSLALGTAWQRLRPGGGASASTNMPPEHAAHQAAGPTSEGMAAHTGMHMPGMVGEVDHAANGFHPGEMLTDYDYGRVSALPDGQVLREYDILAVDKEVELAPGVRFPAWTYNGRIPGPAIRAREGDRIRIHFTNGTAHPHTLHFHGIHPGNMDGVFEPVEPGGEFTYEFDAEPFGVHLYHCHVMPLAKHIAKGLYGAFIIEPKQGWSPAEHELVMVMNGFDVDFDGENEIYAVNSIPFFYDRNPIRIKVGDRVRVFLINMLEYDQINSFHLHANFFHYYPTGTSLEPAEYTDIIAQMQAQRGMLEFTYKHPGTYMFHAHKTEFAELGWTGNFLVEA